MMTWGKPTFGAIVAAVFVATASWAQTEVLHRDLQAVNSMGVSTWTGAHPFVVRGVILNNPEGMLDSTWDPDAVASNRMGAQWQIFIQAVSTNDRGGTALWLGQNYNSLGPWIPEGNHYDEAAWSNEMFRVNFDSNTLHQFRAGDYVEVTARQSLFYGGKRNVNEAHRTTPSNDFSIALIQAGYGLPDPETIVLSNLVSSGTNEIFDATRMTGGEYYQGMRVRLEGIRLTTNYFGTNGWGKTAWAERRCTVTDGEGRYFALRMPLTDLGPAPDDWFSAVGILNQESGSGTDGRFGYELFVQEIGPTLRQIVSGGKVMVYWSGAFTNYVLEYTTNLNDAVSWTNVPRAPVKWIAVEETPGDAGVRYYRLRQRSGP
jgi:hypothetical protein